MYEHEAGQIRRLMKDGPRIIYSDHAEYDRMLRRKISPADIRTVLKKCSVTDVRPGDQGDVYSAEGTDLDGRRLRICVALNPPKTVIVVTTIKL